MLFSMLIYEELLLLNDYASREYTLFPLFPQCGAVVIPSSPESPDIVATGGEDEVWESCPVCGEKLPDYALQLHASLCANDRYSPTSSMVVLD